MRLSQRQCIRLVNIISVSPLIIKLISMMQRLANSVLIKKRNFADMLLRGLQLWWLSVPMDSMFCQAIRMEGFGKESIYC